MKLADVDWTILRGSLAVLVVSAAICGAVVAASHRYSDNMKRAFQRANSTLLGIRGRYQSIDEEEGLIETFLPRYLALEDRGVIGREHRLDWIETLRSASKDLRLPELRYAIASQEPYHADYPLEPGVFQVYVSSMALDLGLLHEDDLPALLERIDQGARGLYRVSRCTISRTRPEFGTDPTTPNLRANCVLEWLTIRQPESEQPA